MKFYLVLIILLFGACSEKKTSAQTSEVADKPEIITPEERASIIAGLENGDYTVLDRFFETNELFPDKILRNGTTVLVNLENSEPIETNDVKFIHNGMIISYTNKYGVEFLESEKLIFTEDELTNQLTAQSFNFIDIQNLAIKTLSVSNLLEFPELLVYFDEHMTQASSIESIEHSTLRVFGLLDLDRDRYPSLFYISNNKELYSYLYSKLVPQDYEKQKIYWLNFLAYLAMMHQQENDKRGYFFPLLYY